MIGSLKELLPQHKLRILTRILLWSGVIICIGIWANLLFQLSRMGRTDTIFKTCFAMEDSLTDLLGCTHDSIALHAAATAESGVFKGWKEAAVWLEEMTAFGDSVHIQIKYSIDSLRGIPGGNPRIRALPVRFRITPENRFDEVLAFMRKMTMDSTVAVRIDNTEFIGSTIGLFDVLISMTGWIRL